MSHADKLELHYYFTDDSHNIDAVIRNRCEAEILAILIEAADILSIDISVNSEAYAEGGFREFWRLLGAHGNQITILLVIISIILSRVPVSDPEIEALEKEIKQLTIEEKKLNIQKLKLELQEKPVEKIDKAVIGMAASYVDKSLKFVKRRSNLYAHLNRYHKVKKVGFNILGKDFEPIDNESIIDRIDFKKFILSSNKLNSEVDESAVIEIVSPVLKEGRYRWKGIYEEKTITFDMLDAQFKEDVLLEKVAFKHGSAITCVLRIGRELDEVGDVKVTGYAVSTVLEISDGVDVSKTSQGNRYLHTKNLRDSQGDLFA
ncbi:hypothetical protein [Aeromonas sp. FDAARGOS 1407]|uniref:hypothetical protein n=1 Tax=Aeromonas TaxID=642 RepID=UPI001C211598|nr:hypothetical protein [Aeromonas sp. FDAARGOS 1407]QXC32673.1 hypothetical protein I6L37_13755 [Aeromonas sp. FDAARGOS 1407]